MSGEYDDQDYRKRNIQSGENEEARQAELHMLKAAEVVNELYDDSASDSSNLVGQGMYKDNDGERTKREPATAEDLHNTTITVFPDRETEMVRRPPMDDTVPVDATGSSLIVDGYRSQPNNPKRPLHGQRRAMHDTLAFWSVVNSNALTAIEAPVPNAHLDASPVGMDRTQHIGPPLSPNPGSLISFSKQNGIAASASLRSNTIISSVAATKPSSKGGFRDYFTSTKVLAKLGDSLKMLSHDGEAVSISRKRKHPNKPSGTDGKLGLTNSKHAQRKSWEPLSETIDSIRRIWSELGHSRIYVTSGMEVAELAIQQHPLHRRLWSWPKDNKEEFDRQIGRLVRDKQYGFLVVCSDTHKRQYCSLDHMEFWKARFQDTKSPYWLAVLTRWRRAAESRPKARKTFNG